MGQIIGYAPGAYDLFHIGHLNILQHAKSRCDVLIAGVVSDELVQHRKGLPPFVPLAERAEIVRHISFVDRVHEEQEEDRLATWKIVGFNRLFKGDDWRGTAKGRRLEEEFATVGVDIVYFPYTVHTSSTMLRRALSLAVAEHELRAEDA